MRGEPRASWESHAAIQGRHAQLPLNLYSGQLPARTALGSCLRVHRTRAQCTGSFRSQESGWSWAWRGAPFIPSHLFCLSEDTAGDILHYRPALSRREARPEASLEHTHKSPGPKKCLLLTRKKPLLRERVRLQKILPSPQTRRSGACLSRLDRL